MVRSPKAPPFPVTIIFLACTLFFLYRGPYRAIRYSTSGDFSTVYAAARCWTHGENPYDKNALKRELASAGAPPDIQKDQNVNPSVYLPAAMPWTAALNWMAWPAANGFWSILSVTVFAISLYSLLQLTSLTVNGKWLAAGAALLFSPTYVGVYDGNPSVVSTGLVTLAICLALDSRKMSAGVALGIAACFKPQVALCALCIFAVRRYWLPLLVSGIVFSLAMLAGVLVQSSGGTKWDWLHSEQRNVAMSFQPGGQSDPTPDSRVAWQLLNGQTLTSYIARERYAADACIWLIAGVLTALVLVFRKPYGALAMWLEIAFFAGISLVITYHRYYDGQLLLLMIPLLVQLWRLREGTTIFLLGACLLTLMFPIQSFFERSLGQGAYRASLIQFMLLRNQPMAILALTVVLAAKCVEVGRQRFGRQLL